MKRIEKITEAELMTMTPPEQLAYIVNRLNHLIYAFNILAGEDGEDL